LNEIGHARASLGNHRCGGFTLVEVLFAMVILAVGLLGLEALGVSAVRSLGLAQRNSRASVVASQHVEDALRLLSVYHESGSGALPQQFCATTPAGNRVSQQIALSSGGHVVRVTVVVTPRAGHGSPIPVTLTSHYHSIQALDAALISGTPCAS